MNPHTVVEHLESIKDSCQISDSKLELEVRALLVKHKLRKSSVYCSSD